jgi:hypothetical protein
MKNLISYFFQFAVIYGIRDKEKFREHIAEWLEPYELDEATRDRFINFAFEFLSTFMERKQQTNLIAGGVKKGVSDLEAKLEIMSEKLERMLKKMPEEEK